MASTMHADQLLIVEVEKHALLYNTQLKTYRNKHLKERAWASGRFAPFGLRAGSVIWDVSNVTSV